MSLRFSCRCNGARGLSVETGERGIGLEQGGAGRGIHGAIFDQENLSARRLRAAVLSFLS